LSEKNLTITWGLGDASSKRRGGESFREEKKRSSAGRFVLRQIKVTIKRGRE